MSDKYNAEEMAKSFRDMADISMYFELDSENTIKLMSAIISGLFEKISRLQREVNHCRNELCLHCGRYHDAHLGACDDCRFRHGGEWSADLDE
jgi:hypothetical protein